jgi:hypothetical protein
VTTHWLVLDAEGISHIDDRPAGARPTRHELHKDGVTLRWSSRE